MTNSQPEQNPTPLPRTFRVGATAHGVTGIHHVPSTAMVGYTFDPEDAALLVDGANGYAALQERLEAAERLNAELVAFMDGIQWNGGLAEAQCVSCGDLRDEGHAAGCYLADILDAARIESASAEEGATDAR